MNFCSSATSASRVKISNILPPISEVAIERSADDPQFYRKLRESIITNFDTSSNRCVDFQGSEGYLLPISRQKNLKKIAGYITLDNKDIPAIATYAPSFSTVESHDDLTIIIRVGGGPGSAELFPASDELIPYYGNVIVLDIYYTGQGFNIIHPHPSFRTAVSQIRAVLLNLRLRNPKANLVLFGESLGARISLSALSGDTINKIDNDIYYPDKIILLSPPFDSLRKTGIILGEMTSSAPAEERRFLYRLREPSTGYNRFGDLRSVSDNEIFQRFFEPQFYNTTLSDEVKKIKNLPATLLIFGTADVRISPTLAPQYQEELGDRIDFFEMKDMEHQFKSSDEVRRISNSIDTFLSF